MYGFTYRMVKKNIQEHICMFSTILGCLQQLIMKLFHLPPQLLNSYMDSLDCYELHWAEEQCPILFSMTVLLDTPLYSLHEDMTVRDVQLHLSGQ